MKNKYHKNLDLKKWQSFSKEEQISNIAAELSRTKNWLAKNDKQEVLNCLNRVFELIDLTIQDTRWLIPAPPRRFTEGYGIMKRRLSDHSAAARMSRWVWLLVPLALFLTGMGVGQHGR